MPLITVRLKASNRWLTSDCKMPRDRVSHYGHGKYFHLTDEAHAVLGGRGYGITNITLNFDEWIVGIVDTKLALLFKLAYV